jgi:hypothetical protein
MIELRLADQTGLSAWMTAYPDTTLQIRYLALRLSLRPKVTTELPTNQKWQSGLWEGITQDLKSRLVDE